MRSLLGPLKHHEKPKTKQSLFAACTVTCDQPAPTWFVMNLIDCGWYCRHKIALNLDLNAATTMVDGDGRFDTLYNLVCIAGLQLLSQAVSPFSTYLFICLPKIFVKGSQASQSQMSLFLEPWRWVFMSLFHERSIFLWLRQTLDLQITRTACLARCFQHPA